MKLLQLFCCMLLLGSSMANAKLVSKELSYQQGGETFNGYYAYDDSFKGKRPGVLVVHEWWGYNDYTRHRADMLAAMGYAALALDMYGKGKLAEHPDTAMKFMQAVMSQPEQAAQRFDAATQLLKQQPQVKRDSIAAIGYCFGGAVVLNMARAGKDLKGVVSFHGSLSSNTPAEPGAVLAKIQVYNGAIDPFVTTEQVAAFNQEMSAAGVDYSFVNMAGAKHGFSNPAADAAGKTFGMPLAYDQTADERSWAGMAAFFEAIFK